MKKMTLAVLAITLICFSVIMGCKKSDEQAAPATDQQTQPADQGKEAPAPQK